VKDKAISYCSISYLKHCLSNEEEGMQDDILWDKSKQSSKGHQPQRKGSAADGSLDQHSDHVQTQRNACVSKIYFYFVLAQFPVFFTLSSK
jgi:hypothetical protein